MDCIQRGAARRLGGGDRAVLGVGRTPSASGPSSRRTTASPPRSGGRWRMPTSWALPCPSRREVPARGSWSCASCSRRRATRWRPCRSGRPSCSGPSPSRTSARRPSAPAGCPASSPGTWSSPPPSPAVPPSPTSSPAVRATAQGDGWVLDGTELAVPRRTSRPGSWCRPVLRAAACCSRRRPGAPGVSLERALTTNREVHPHLHLAGVTVVAEEVLVGADVGRSTLDFLSVAATDRVVRAAGRRVRGGAHTDRGEPERPSPVRAPAEHVPGHDAAGGELRHRHRGDAGHLAERRVALRQRAATPPTRRGRPNGRPPSAGSGRCTPPNTSTAAWVRTSPTRSTATSCGASR